VTQDVELQLRQTMRNLLDNLEEADMDFPDVVQATVYVRDIKDIEKVQTLYGTFFKGAFPPAQACRTASIRRRQPASRFPLSRVRQPKR
jgi:2-iminobutanoate/2-iminopropanoate deaminase